MILIHRYMMDLLTLVEKSPEPVIPGQSDPPQMITLTERAVTKIKDLLAEENNPKLKLRVFVQGGGCSGMQTGFTLDEEQSDDDFEIQSNGVHLLVDSMSSGYLQGSTVDYRDDINGSTFVITGMESTTTCGCGSSFSPY